MHVHNVSIGKENSSVKLLNEIPFTILLFLKIINESLLTLSKLLCNSSKMKCFSYKKKSINFFLIIYPAKFL